MAKTITDKKVKMGRLIPVENQNPLLNAKNVYYALKTENEKGNDEKWLLLTENEISSRTRLDMGEASKSWKVGRIYPHNVGKKKGFAMKVELLDGTEQVLLFGESWFRTGLARANRNPEDVPKVSWLEDLKD